MASVSTLTAIEIIWIAGIQHELNFGAAVQGEVQVTLISALGQLISTEIINGKRWKKVEVCPDSGAYDLVAPPSMAPNIIIEHGTFNLKPRCIKQNRWNPK